MGRILNLLKREVRRYLRDSDPDPDPDPRYGESVSYAPCPHCGEGSLVCDTDGEIQRCNVCGERVDDAT